MNILHVYKDYYPVLGGMENHIRVLAEAQVRLGHQVTVLATHPGRGALETRLNGVRVIKTSSLATLASTPISPGFAAALARLRPHLTHLHAPYPLGEVSQWLVGRGRPYVVTYHADVTRPLQRAIMLAYGPLFTHILRRAARVIATSATYAAASPYLRRVSERTAVVPLGVDLSRFEPAAGAVDRPPTVLFVGRLRHYKGVDDLLRAAATMRADVRLLVAGDGPMRAEWEALRESLGLGARVRFVGSVPDDDLPALYQAADVFALPATSRAEAFGTVLLEAMASGLPCVTTNVGSGTHFVVQDGETGLVVPPAQPAALAEAIARLLADDALRAQMGQAGRRRALEHFSVDRMIEGVEAVYRTASIVK